MTTNKHLVLLGDSIFDNAAYVRGGVPVIDHVRRMLPRDWQATLVAVDGNVAMDVERQLQRLPAGATHLVVSVGGNDALQASALLFQPVASAEQLLRELASVQEEFSLIYRAMLRSLAETRLPAVVCTIYDAIPGMQRWELAPLSLFNDIIVREAALAGVPVIDLRPICSQPGDYSTVSPIEPSTAGGFKIAQAVTRVICEHEFGTRRCVVYTA